MKDICNLNFVTMNQVSVLCCLYFMALTPFMCWAMTQAQKDQIREHFEEKGVECMADYPVSPEDIEDLRATKNPAGANAPCFIACMFKKVGVMSEDGMLVGDNAIELAKKVFDDAEELESVKNYLHSCASVNTETVSDGAKGCERALLAYKCMMANAEKFGFQI